MPSVADAVADCELVGRHDVCRTSRSCSTRLRRLEYGARLILRKLPTAPVALLFGSEKFGLSNDDLSHCHWLMRIPTVGQDLSMNLGQAVALCLYELARDPKAADASRPHPPRRRRKRSRSPASSWRPSTRAATSTLTGVSTEEKIRRLVRRMDIAGRDAPVLMGMLKQILWKLENG